MARAAREDALGADPVDGGGGEVEGPDEREEARGGRLFGRELAELGAVLFEVVVPARGRVSVPRYDVR